ncbi:MAG: c-type cytochrome, partial [Gemmataceae bacterium]|nr:c-type cytochrome [Gemmataceae bacterium]
MSYRYCVPAVALLLLLAPAARAVDPADLKPGLVALYVGGQDRFAQNAMQIEPAPAWSLNTGEAPHPRLPDTIQHGEWNGYVNVVRPGKYRFSATVRSAHVSVNVAGKQVLAATGDQTGAMLVTGDEVGLPGGVLKFSASITPGQGPSQFELLWEGPGFVREPLPHQYLGHLPGDRGPQFNQYVQLERGRFRFEELACARCHKPAADDKMAKWLADHPGPNLTDVAKRAHAGWIDAWLADPAKLRPHTTMPKLFADDAAGRTERYAVLRYLVSLSGKPLDVVKAPAVSNEYRQSMDRGKVL